MKLEFRRFDLRLRHAWTVSSGAKGGGANLAPTVLVRLTHKGVTGLGEAPTANRYADTAESTQGFLRRVDPEMLSFDDIPASMAYLEGLAPGSSSAKCALNVALVDGAARQAGQAVCDFLGLGFSENKHVTSFSIGIDTPEKIAQKVAEAAGYPILKLKIGAEGDRENLAALRRAAPIRTVRVDANEGWATKEEALRNLECRTADARRHAGQRPGVAQESFATAAVRGRIVSPREGRRGLRGVLSRCQCEVGQDGRPFGGS
jgi:L-alanine-DL-glutamate epimerase-like enolase superfamily enzyme